MADARFLRFESMPDKNRHAFPRDLLDEAEHAELPPLVSPVLDEVSGLDVVRPSGETGERATLRSDPGVHSAGLESRFEIGASAPAEQQPIRDADRVSRSTLRQTSLRGRRSSASRKLRSMRQINRESLHPPTNAERKARRSRLPPASSCSTSQSWRRRAETRPSKHLVLANLTASVAPAIGRPLSAR